MSSNVVRGGFVVIHNDERLKASGPFLTYLNLPKTSVGSGDYSQALLFNTRQEAEAAAILLTPPIGPIATTGYLRVTTELSETDTPATQPLVELWETQRDQ